MVAFFRVVTLARVFFPPFDPGRYLPIARVGALDLDLDLSDLSAAAEFKETDATEKRIPRLPLYESDEGSRNCARARELSRPNDDSVARSSPISLRRSLRLPGSESREFFLARMFLVDVLRAFHFTRMYFDARAERIGSSASIPRVLVSFALRVSSFTFVTSQFPFLPERQSEHAALDKGRR